MTKQLRFLTLAAMLLLPLAACDEGNETVAPDVTGSITGTVTADGAGLAGVTVTLNSGKTATTGATGQYTISDVPAGAYTVTISGAPADVAFQATTQATVIATAGQVQTVNFAGARIRTSSIFGSVTTTGGVGLGGVTVTAVGPETKAATTGTGASLGQYSIAALRAGTYAVTITGIPAGNSCTTTSQSVTVAAGESKVVSFACGASAPPSSTGRIAGILFLDENDKNNVYDGATLEETLKAANVLITLEGPTVGTSYSTNTDANGAFSFTSLAAGSYNITINATDADIPASVVYGGTSATLPSIVLANAQNYTAANFPFDVLNETLLVSAFLGRDADAVPAVAPVAGVVLDLYPTQADAIALTNRIGRDTTNAAGEVQFSFLRSADTSPAGTTPDQIVFAQISNVANAIPAFMEVNGETRIEVRYNPRTSTAMAPDSFDLLNTRVLLKADAFGVSGGPLVGWDMVLYANDTTIVSVDTKTTNAQGRVDFVAVVTTVPTAALPDTFYIRLASAQAAAGGHTFTQAPAAERGTAVSRWLRFVHDGLTRATDTVDVGDERVTFADTDILVRVHHERDDSLSGRPVLTTGDDETGVANIQVALRYTNSAGTVVDVVGAAPAADGTVLFPNIPTNRAPYRVGATSLVGTQFVLEEDTLFTVGQGGLGDMSGGTFTTFVCPLGRNQATAAGCSTFAHKYQNGTINITVRDSTATQLVNADSVKVRVRSDPRTIQPRPTDTLLTVSRGGVGGFVSLTGIREGFYIVSILHDSINAAGDTVWAFSGASNNTATVDMENDNVVQNVYFIPRRGDTQVQGVVVNDRDQDQNTIDGNEGLANVTVQLYRDGSGTAFTRDTLVKTVTTDANGAYSFTGLRENRYMVRVTSPSGAVVLRAFNASGVAVDSAIVTTAATAAATCQNADNLRRVGTSDVTCFSAGNPLPRWDYATSTAQNVGPSSFTFLYSTGTATGLIRKADLTAVPSMSVTLRRCLLSSAPNTPTAGTCGSYDTSFAAATTTTDANGRYTFSSLREGVYEATPNAATVTGYTSTTPANMLLTINAPADIETANFTANP